MLQNKTQKHILTQLLKTNGARYSALRPKDVENDLFPYHLKSLLESELVIKNDGLYYLSQAGKKFVTEESPMDAAGEVYTLFRVNGLGIVLKQIDGITKILSQMRKNHPFFGNVGIIGGPILKGFSIEESMSHQVKKETGIEAEFTEAGLIRHSRYTSEGNLFSDIFYHVCVAEISEGEPEPDNEFGVHFWSDLPTAIKFEQYSSQGSIALVKYFEQLVENKPQAIPYFHTQEQKVVPSV